MPRKKKLKCTKCGRRKPVTQFSPYKAIARGYHYYCKSCRNKDGFAWRQTRAGKAKIKSNSRKIMANRKYTPKAKAQRTAYSQAYWDKYPGRRNAMLRARCIELKGRCERCRKKPAKVRHHPDYRKHLEVKLLCKTCQSIANAKKKAKVV